MLFWGVSSSSTIVTQGSAGLLTTCVRVWGFRGVFRPNFSLTSRMGRKRLLIGQGTCILHRKGNSMAQNRNSGMVACRFLLTCTDCTYYMQPY